MSETTGETTIFLRWDMKADSWIGVPSLLSIHQTLEGAVNAIPESLKKDTYIRPPFGAYVVNYTYEAIEARVIQA